MLRKHTGSEAWVVFTGGFPALRPLDDLISPPCRLTLELKQSAFGSFKVSPSPAKEAPGSPAHSLLCRQAT